MYKVCKTEQSAARQKELEQLLLKEMLNRHFEDISISDLCDGVNIPRKAFYRYFSGKRGALHALIDHTLMDFDALTYGMEQNSRVGQRRYLELYFRFWDEHRPLLDAIARSELWGELVERSIEYALAELERSRHFPSSSHLPEAEYMARFTIGGMIAVIQVWQRSGFTLTPQQLTSMFSNQIHQALEFWTK